MIIKKIASKDHPEDTEYTLIVSTDSSVERDIILKYLAQAQQVYQSWLQGQTKALPKAEVIYGVRIEGDEFFENHKKDYNTLFCAQCESLIFFQTKYSGYHNVICPGCGYKKRVLVHKGENENE